MQIMSYIRLMRVDKPAGFLLLWAPTAWALWLANNGMPSISLFLYFILGTVCMRSAGCIINDLADRNIDPYVKRTCKRPLATGEVTIKNAIICLLVLLFISAIIAWQLPFASWIWIISALAITCIYPLCKRFLATPQLVLGFAFSMGIPIAYKASLMPFDCFMWILMVLNWFWIVAYDTIYAMNDLEDDYKIGVNSTAIFFGKYNFLILIILQIIFHSLWLIIAINKHYSILFYIFWIISGFLLIYQDLIIKKSKSYMQAFLNNSWYGLLMWLAIIVQQMIV